MYDIVDTVIVLMLWYCWCCGIVHVHAGVKVFMIVLNFETLHSLLSTTAPYIQLHIMSQLIKKYAFIEAPIVDLS